MRKIRVILRDGSDFGLGLVCMLFGVRVDGVLSCVPGSSMTGQTTNLLTL